MQAAVIPFDFDPIARILERDPLTRFSDPTPRSLDNWPGRTTADVRAIVREESRRALAGGGLFAHQGAQQAPGAAGALYAHL